MLRIFNTLTKQIEEIQPLEPGKVRMYTCGPTVYRDAHIGNLRTYLMADWIRRALEIKGIEVHHVKNITDVGHMRQELVEAGGDKMILAALEEGKTTQDIAQFYADRFHADEARMNIRPAHVFPWATQHIPEMVAIIEKLMANGSAYEAGGNIYFNVNSFADYGKLSRNTGADLLEGVRAEADPLKKDPRDFTLWKAAEPGRDLKWESPWGDGFPGWHIECSAMCCSELGTTIDIHGGGLDLVFPHHENEIAQSEGANKAPFARYWMHNGMLTLSSGQKMGKSLDNVFNVQDILVEYPAEVLRLYYLQSAYRSALPWNAEALPDALGMLCRLYEAREVAESMGGEESANQVAQSLGSDALKVLEYSEAFETEFLACLDRDFNTSNAMARLFELVRAVNRFANHKKARKKGGPVVAQALKCFELVSQSLGLLGMNVADFMEEVKDRRLGAMGISRDDIEAMIQQRAEARSSQEWARADEIRDRLLDMSIVLMDRPEGVDWRVRVGS